MINAKVKVSKEVAEALNDRLAYNNPADIVATSASNGWEERGRSTVGCLNRRHLDLDTLIRAVYYGYEVEETAGEKVAYYYRQQLGRSRGIFPGLEFAECRARMEAVEFVAKAYGLKIEGVNV